MATKGNISYQAEERTASANNIFNWYILSSESLLKLEYKITNGSISRIFIVNHLIVFHTHLLPVILLLRQLCIKWTRKNVFCGQPWSNSTISQPRYNTKYIQYRPTWSFNWGALTFITGCKVAQIHINNIR